MGRLFGLSVLLAAVSCTLGSELPQPTLDSSWSFGVHAWASGSHGDVPVTFFTYGPLGFLSEPVIWARSTYLPALVVALAAQVALCRVLLARLVRVLPLAPAAVGTFVLACLSGMTGSELLMTVAALAAAEALQADVQPDRWWFPVAAGLAGLTLLVKFSTGTVCVLVLVLVTGVLSGPSPRRRLLHAAGAGASALAVAFLAFWVVTARPEAFPGWLRASQEVARGYTAMASEVPGPADRDYAWAVVLLALLLGTAAVLAVRQRRPEALATGALVALVGYVGFREGFTRHDSGHVAIFASLLLLLPLALVLTGRATALLVPLLLGPLLLSAVQLHSVHGADLDARSHLRVLVDRLHLVTDAAETQQRSRRALVADYALPASVLDELRGHRVNVDPWDTAVIWAYGLRWAPSAVWAMYSSYSPWLDDRNAASLVAGGPDRVLRRYGTAALDGRNPAFESPAYQLEELCGWQELVRTRQWQVLGRTTSRCGTPTVLGRVRLVPNQQVPVPQPSVPGAVVTVRLELDPGRAYRLESLLFKPERPRRVLLDGRSWRLVLATASQPLVLVSPPGLPGMSDVFASYAHTMVGADLPGTAVFEQRVVTCGTAPCRG